MAGPERIELPSHGSKPRILSVELKAELERNTRIELVTCPWQGYILPLN